jgi:hypothetical protein
VWEKYFSLSCQIPEAPEVWCGEDASMLEKEASRSEARSGLEQERSAVSQAICSHLDDDWEFFMETRIKRIFHSMQGNTTDGERQPDGVFSRKSDVKHVLVDFNRGYGSTRQDLHKQEETK